MNEALICRPLDLTITGTRYPNNRGLQNPDRHIVQTKVTSNTIHAACGHGEGDENTDPERRAPKKTNNRAPPISQVVHNLVSERSSDHALRVAPGTRGMKRVLGWARR